MNREFLVKDKSGRGFNTTVELEQLLDGWEDEEDDYDNMLHEWASESSDVGDEWEVYNLKVIRIK